MTLSYYLYEVYKLKDPFDFYIYYQNIKIYYMDIFVCVRVFVYCCNYVTGSWLSEISIDQDIENIFFVEK